MTTDPRHDPTSEAPTVISADTSPETALETSLEISPAELLGLVRAAGRTPEPPSPLLLGDAAAVTAIDPSPETRERLHVAGWLTGEATPALTPLGEAVVDRLCSPGRFIELVLGSESWWYRWIGLGVGGLDDPLLAWSMVPETAEPMVQVSFPHPPRWPADLLTAHLRARPIGSPTPFEHALSDRAAAVWLAVLDHQLDLVLRSALDRLPVTDEGMSASALELLLIEGRTGTHLSWQVTTSIAIWPDLPLGLDADAVDAGLTELTEAGILVDDDGYRLEEPTAEVIRRLVPVARWASYSIMARNGSGELEVIRRALRRGHGVVLAEHRPIEGGTVHLRSISDDELELELLRVASSETLSTSR